VQAQEANCAKAEAVIDALPPGLCMLADSPRMGPRHLESLAGRRAVGEMIHTSTSRQDILEVEVTAPRDPKFPGGQNPSSADSQTSAVRFAGAVYDDL
jgi:plasmid stabilization system protein ParE